MLAGLLPAEQSKQEAESEPKAGFKKQPEMSLNDQVIFEVIRGLEQAMDGSQLKLTGLIIQKLAAEPQRVLEVAELLSVES